MAEEFLIKFYKSINIIAFNPKVGMKTTKDMNIRKYIITKHNTLYYQIENNRVELLAIFFNKNNPIKNIFE